MSSFGRFCIVSAIRKLQTSLNLVVTRIKKLSSFATGKHFGRKLINANANYDLMTN